MEEGRQYLRYKTSVMGQTDSLRALKFSCPHPVDYLLHFCSQLQVHPIPSQLFAWFIPGAQICLTLLCSFLLHHKIMAFESEHVGKEMVSENI